MGHKKDILIVDDSRLIRTQVRGILESDERLNVVGEAANGLEALTMISRDGPDVIVLDLEMPGMGGLEFLRHAKLRTRARVVVLSSIVALGSKSAAMARALGADAVISKPSGVVSMDIAEKRGALLTRVVADLAGLV